MRRILSAIIVISIMLFIGIVVFPQTAITQSRTLKVGLLTPMTGINPDWGKKQVVGMKMAVEDVSKRGGVNGMPLVPLIYDSGADPERALAFYRKMAVEDGVLVVIGPLYSNECEAIFPVTNEMKVPVIATASADPGLSDLQKRPYAFRMTVTSDKKEVPLLKAWASEHGIRKVVILYDKQTSVLATIATRIWPAAMKELNVEILNRDDPISIKPGEEDFNDQVKRTMTYQPDGICIAAWPKEAGFLIRDIRRQGLNQPIMGSSTTANPKIIEIAGDAAEGLQSVTLYYPEDPNPSVQSYVKEFKGRCEKEYPSMNCDSEQYDVVVHDILHEKETLDTPCGSTGRKGLHYFLTLV